MKKALILMALAAVAWAVMLLRKSPSGGARSTMWQKMQESMEAMPQDFPPRAMFDNVAATRENTERILEILGEREAKAGSV